MIAKAPFAHRQLLRLMAGAGCFAVWLTASLVHAAAPLHIDLTPAAPPAITGHLGLGETNAPGGRTLGADSQCLYRDGQPFIPVMGEFHFTRYPAGEWREALLKMKAGGIDIVATYVFWIHHEEEQGKWDWTGRRSLRDFLRLCKELDLLAVVRLGPWSHGEVRNGGFPDWLQHAEFWGKDGCKRCHPNPEFMKLAAVLYQQIAAQLQGLLWKDGGPVIGVQHDNECWNLPYLHALKKLARDCGVDVPFYTMTGWNAVPIPDEGLLPLFGGYSDGFWMDDPTGMRKAFLFTPIRDDSDMGAIGGRLTNTRPERNAKIQRFPYLCCEIGGGMPSSYRNRIDVTPADVTSLALVKLGEGNNLPGYYMYHGGVNPEGKLTTLNETKATGYPNDLPVKDYDFGPLSAAGQAREHYFLLRQQHLFLRDFGVDLARMPAFFPEQMPATLDDTNTVRWSVRSDGERAFLFFNNHQRYQQLPAKADVQFALQTNSGEQLIPRQHVTLPAGSFGLWPVNLDCAGVRLDYATAQPLCRLEADGQHWFFFAALKGIAPEIAVTGEKPKKLKAGTGVALTRKAADGSKVNFIVLTPEQGRQLWKLRLAGSERVVLSANTLLPETPDQVILEALAPAAPALAVFPPVAQASVAGRAVKTKRDGIFQSFSFTGPAPEITAVECPPVRPAVGTTNVLNAMDESAWTSAAVWRVRVPTAVAARESLLRIHYVGDVARVYADGRLVLDNFYNGQPFDVPLWRLSPAELASLEIHLLPWRAGMPHRIAAEAKPKLEDGRPVGELLRVESLSRTRLAVSLVSDGR
jgi:beta-galactosidase